jgi:hypothetical protein
VLQWGQEHREIREGRMLAFNKTSNSAGGHKNEAFLSNSENKAHNMGPDQSYGMVFNYCCVISRRHFGRALCFVT